MTYISSDEDDCDEHGQLVPGISSTENNLQSPRNILRKTNQLVASRTTKKIVDKTIPMIITPRAMSFWLGGLSKLGFTPVGGSNAGEYNGFEMLDAIFASWCFDNRATQAVANL